MIEKTEINLGGFSAVLEDLLLQVVNYNKQKTPSLIPLQTIKYKSPPSPRLCTTGPKI